MLSALAQRLLLVAGSLAFACVLTEAGFRVAGYAQGIDYRLYLKELKNSDRLPRQLFRADPATKTALVPNRQALAVTSDFSVVYSTNAKGLRDRDYEYDKPRDKLRILALGDSLTFGEGVAYGERFADIPEAELEGLEIVNAAVPGWGLESELVWLVREGLRYRPDRVVIFINFVATQRLLPGLVRDGEVVLPDAADAPPSGPGEAGGESGTWFVRADDPLFRDRGFLVRHSWALSYLTFRLTLAMRRGSLEEQDAERWRGKNAGREVAEEIADLSKPSERTMIVLRKFVEIANAEGFALTIVNISSWATMSFVGQVDPRVDYFDLAPLLGEEARRQPVTFRYDPHYTPRAHALLGHELTRIFRPYVEDYRSARRSGAGG